MTVSEVTEKLNDFSIVDKNNLNLVVLGGSRGCGYAGEESDYDLNFYSDNDFKKWESCLDSYGYVKIKNSIVHWYLHPLDISCSTNPTEFFFYSKMPLIEPGCFYPCNKNGEILMNLFLKKSDDISLFYLRSFFDLYSIEKQDYPIKWNYGLALLANYFQCADFSRAEILSLKKEKTFSPNKNPLLFAALKKLREFILSQDEFSLSDRLWNQ